MVDVTQVFEIYSDVTRELSELGAEVPNDQQVALLEEQGALVLAEIEELCQEKGIPIDMPGNRRLLIETIGIDSDYIGKRVQECCSTERREEVDLVALIRDEQMIFPYEETQLIAGDRLLLIASYDAWPRYQNHFEPEREFGS